MSEARVVRLDDFRKAPRRHNPRFMLNHYHRELLDLMQRASLEAQAFATQLKDLQFDRGEMFASDEEAAAALRYNGTRHVQVRRLLRLKQQFPELFALVDEISRAALDSYAKAETAPKTRWKNTPKNPRKTQQTRQIASTDSRTSVEVQPLQAESTTEGESPVAALAAEGRASPDASREKGGARPNRRDPPKCQMDPSGNCLEAPLPEDWRPDDPDIDDPAVAQCFQRFRGFHTQYRVPMADPDEEWRSWKQHQMGPFGVSP